MINGIHKLMFASAREPINLGNLEEVSIIAVTESKSKIVFKPLPEDDPKVRCPDINQAKRLLKWHPNISLKEGLKYCLTYK